MKFFQYSTLQSQQYERLTKESLVYGFRRCEEHFVVLKQQGLPVDGRQLFVEALDILFFIVLDFR